VAILRNLVQTTFFHSARFMVVCPHLLIVVCPHLLGSGKVLCFRTYGRDIVSRLKLAGFRHAEIDFSSADRFMGYGRPVVIAHK